MTPTPNRAPRRPTRSAVTLGLFVAACFAACGPKKPSLADEDSRRPGSDAGPQFVVDDSAPQCGVLEDGGPCGCLELSILTDLPNLYFVLDRSGSMSENNKWQTVRTVVAQTLVKLGPRVSFGVTTYPRATSSCDAGVEVMPVTQGDAPAGRSGSAVLRFLSATSGAANGGTPTAGTLRGVMPSLAALSGRTYVVLATDGGPNCNDAATCDESTCIPNIEAAAPECQPNKAPNCCTAALLGATNCLDDAETESAVAALKAAGIDTYVIGVPGSGPYAALLDKLAVAGGAARPTSPRYYRVDSTDAAALEVALRAIAAKVTASCELPINPPPADPTRLNVFFDDVVLPADPVNGWRYEAGKVTLLGEACQRLTAGEVLGLRVVAGCPTVAPR